MSAAEVARLDDAALKACGLSAPKVRTLRAVARAVLDDGLDLEGAGALPEEALREALISIHGVGPWTADIFQMFCLGRADAFAPGDLALQIAAQYAFELDDRPSAGGTGSACGGLAAVAVGVGAVALGLLCRREARPQRHRGLAASTNRSARKLTVSLHSGPA